MKFFGYESHGSPLDYDLTSWDWHELDTPERAEQAELQRLARDMSIDLSYFTGLEQAFTYLRQEEVRYSSHADAVAADIRQGNVATRDDLQYLATFLGQTEETPLDIKLQRHDQRRTFMNVVRCALDLHTNLADVVRFMTADLAAASEVDTYEPGT